MRERIEKDQGDGGQVVGGERRKGRKREREKKSLNVYLKWTELIEG